jgi:hypothetical protein
MGQTESGKRHGSVIERPKPVKLIVRLNDSHHRNQKGIECLTLGGVIYRSKTEAIWGEFLKSWGWKVEYEPKAKKDEVQIDFLVHLPGIDALAFVVPSMDPNDLVSIHQSIRLRKIVGPVFVLGAHFTKAVYCPTEDLRQSTSVDICFHGTGFGIMNIHSPKNGVDFDEIKKSWNLCEQRFVKIVPLPSLKRSLTRADSKVFSMDVFPALPIPVENEDTTCKTCGRNGHWSKHCPL